MINFKSSKILQTKEWKSLVISEILNGYFLGVEFENGKLTYYKSNGKELDDIDLGFFPSYYRAIKYIENFIKLNDYSMTKKYEFEIFDPFIINSNTNKPYIQNQKNINVIQMDGDFNSPFLKPDNLEIIDFIEYENFLKENDDKNFEFLKIKLENNKMFETNNKGFVLNIGIETGKNEKSNVLSKISDKSKIKIYQTKILNPKQNDKKSIEYYISKKGIDFLNRIGTKSNLNPIDFAIKFYKDLFIEEQNESKKNLVDEYGIKINNQTIKIPTEVLKDKRLLLIFKSATLFKRKLDTK